MPYQYHIKKYNYCLISLYSLEYILMKVLVNSAKLEKKSSKSHCYLFNQKVTNM